MNWKKLLFRAGSILIVLAMAATMFIIGRGHTVYFDNKTLEYNGQEYKAYYRVEVAAATMDKTAKLGARERGMATWIGQNFHMDLLVTKAQGDDPVSYSVNLKLPYSMDGVIVNLPAVLNGLPQETWYTEFIPTPSSVEEEEIDLGEDFSVDGAEDMVELDEPAA